MKEESRIVEETRQKIASGELTYDQMKEKLIAAINKEYEKEGEPNIELINACEELLAELATDGQPLPESHQEKYWEVIRQNIQVSHRSRNRRGFAKRLAVSLVVLVLLLGGGQVFLHREWLEHGTTDDEQQHIIQGFVVDPGLVAKAIAAEQGEVQILTTKNPNDIADFLGFELPMNLLLNGWDINLFRAVIQPEFIKCSVRYTNIDEETLTIQIKLFSTIENAYTSFEQDIGGEEEEILGIKIYHYINEKENSYIWMENNCTFHCHGELTDSQFEAIIKELVGGE